MSEAVADKRATYADIEALPEHVTGEIVAGFLHTSPRPAVQHARVETSIAHDVFGRFDRGQGGPGGWHILVEPELHLGDDVIVPDLAGWRHTTLAELPVAPAIEIAPDWVCEITSPSTENWDRKAKMPVYYRERVGHVWLVSPEAERVEVFRYGPESWYFEGVFTDETEARIQPFDAVGFDLRLWWGRQER